MSLVELRNMPRHEAISGGAMDKIVERKRVDKRILIGGAAAAALVLFLFFWLFAPRSDSQSVDRSRLSIATVQTGTFEDFLPLRSRVTPLLTVYLDAVEGKVPHLAEDSFEVAGALVADGVEHEPDACHAGLPLSDGRMLAMKSRYQPKLSFGTRSRVG